MICFDGNFELIKKLYLEGKINKEFVVNSYINNGYLNLFQISATANHLELCKWLHETFQITKEEAVVDENFAFEVACVEGNLEIVKWLQETFAFTKEEVSHNNNYALELAFYYDHFEIVYFLRDIYGFVKEDTNVFIDQIPEEDREKLFECLTPVGSFTKGAIRF